MKSNQYQRVKDLLHKYTIIQPSNAQVFCLMAEVLQQTNDIEHAKSWSVKCLTYFFSCFHMDIIQVSTSIKYPSIRWTFTSTNRRSNRYARR